MEISAKMVKDLRECTGAGMMDCKKALSEVEGDMDAAIDLLRTKGLAALAKKAGRATNEGIIGGFVSDDRRVAALVEVNCETDFVARNADFKAFVAEVAAHVATAAPADVSALMAQSFSGRTETFEAVLGETVGKIGENMGVARFARYEVAADFGAITVYIHGVGNIGVVLELSVSTAEAASSDAFAALGKDLAMQVAAAGPYAVSRDKIAADVVAHELAIFKAQAAESGKPEEIQTKMAEGRLEKFYKEVALLEQVYVKDNDVTVKQYVEQVAKEVGASIEVVRFDRFVLGETATGGE
ncbi:MAG: translation elongation factor Ts [Coriobacteriia bacterium]|nr:translation elongation factor Ts [Coriobacteriia bacterium]